MSDNKEMRKLMEAVKEISEYYGSNDYAYGYSGGGGERTREPKNGKPKGKGNIRTCGNCGGRGHFGDDDPSDDEFCIICAGTGKVAMNGTKYCSSCDGYGHFADGDDEISDDEYCFNCAGPGLVAGKYPEFNPKLDGTLEPPPER